MLALGMDRRHGFNLATLAGVLGAAILILPALAAAQVKPANQDRGEELSLPKPDSNSDWARTYREQPRTGDGSAFAPIGIIEPKDKVPFKVGGEIVPDNIRATATLISPCYVLTNFHAVYGDVSATDPGIDNAADHLATFFVGDDPTVGFKYQLTATPVEHGNFSPGGSPQEDWALLHLEKCAGLSKSIGWMEISKIPWPNFRKYSLVLAAYPGGYDTKKLWISSPCNGTDALGIDGSVIHNCHSLRGTSGGMAIGRRNDGVLFAVFMNKGVTENDVGLGVDLPSLVQSPKFDRVRDDLTKWGVPNPARVNAAQRTPGSGTN